MARHHFPGGPGTYSSYNGTSTACRDLIEKLNEQNLNEWKWKYPWQVVQHLSRSPWNKQQYPTIADIVDSNDKWYSETKSTFTPHTPVDLKLSSPDGPPRELRDFWCSAGQDLNEAFMDRFLLRAARRWGSGDVTGAIDDISFARQIADRHRMEMRGVTYCFYRDAEILRLVATCLLESPLSLPESRKLLAVIPAASTRKHVAWQLERTRLSALDTYQLMRSRRFSLFFVADERSKFRHLLEQRIRVQTDWNAVLQAENSFYDEFQQALNRRTLAEAPAEVKLLQADDGLATSRRLQQKTLLDPTATTEEIIEAYGYSRRQNVLTLTRAMHHDLRKKAVHIIAGLVAWKQAEGTYPESLELLTAADSPLRIDRRILIDPFSGSQLAYRRTSTGFELRSVGEDQQISEGFYLDFEHKAHRTVDRSADILWRWPIDVDTKSKRRQPGHKFPL